MNEDKASNFGGGAADASLNQVSILRVLNLQKAYGTAPPVLNDINLTLLRGEFVVILGLSGAGKSTLLRCLNSLIVPTAGSILVRRSTFLGPGAEAELDVLTLAPRELELLRRKIGMVFQQFNLVKRLTVLDNVLSGYLGYSRIIPSLLHLYPAAVRERAFINLERVGLLSRAYQRADTLSGGQQQRVAIARALMQQPAIILADEPVASLDPRLSRQVLDILRRICREDGITVLVSLHILELAREYADRVVGLQGGRLVFDGKPEELTTAAVSGIYLREATGELPPPHSRIDTETERTLGLEIT